MKKGLKLIKQGVVSYAPDKPETRQYFEQHNERIRRFRPRFAEAEMVIIMEASEQEYKEHILAKVIDKPKAAPQLVKEENSVLREQMAQMQQQLIMMQGLLLQQNVTAPTEDKKRGRPTKSEKNEKDNSTDGEAGTEAIDNEAQA